MKIFSTKIIAIFSTLFISLLCSFQKSASTTKSEKRYYNSACNCFVKETYHKNYLLSIEQYSDSIFRIKTGVTVYFYENGDTLDLSHYENGQLQGYSYNKYNNGLLGVERHYKNNSPVGNWKYFDEKGILKSEIIYDSDNSSGFNNRNRLEKYYGTSERLMYIKRFLGADSVILNVVDTILYEAYLQKLSNRTGYEIILANCASCHNPIRDATGPKLAGVTKRRTEKWLRSWISNSSKMIAEGDTQAVELYNKWGKTTMTAFPISDNEMDKIIDYLKSIE